MKLAGELNVYQFQISPMDFALSVSKEIVLKNILSITTSFGYDLLEKCEL